MVYTDEIIKQKQNRKIKNKKILKIITLPIIILIIIAIGYVAYVKYIKKENDISVLGFRQYIVMTGSMEPTYNIGDLIVIKEKPKEDIKVNDVITYTLENSQSTITHRVTEISEEKGQTIYKTKGDNNNSEDADIVNYDQVKGVVLFKISKVGAILSKLITGTSIIIIFIIIGICYFRDSRKEEKRIAREDTRKMYNIPKYEEEDGI